MRKKLLAGNWKMNKLQKDLPDFFESLVKEVKTNIKNNEKVDVLFAVPYTLLEKANSIAKPLGIIVAAENVHFAEKGAYTGEVSISMLKEIGIESTIIGHSERRTYFGETDETVAKKVRACLDSNILPIICVGETLQERESGKTQDVITTQVNAVLDIIKSNEDFVIAYEPVWAIGTGKTATNEQAQEVHSLIRGLIKNRLKEVAAEKTRILYGGSANPKNISALLDQKDIDGGLVGGASLVASDFATMINIANDK